MNELSMTERETIIGLLRLRWTQRRIERETGHRRETIARIGREAGLLPPKPAKVPTDLGEAIAVPGTHSRSVCEPYRDIIAAEFAKGLQRQSHLPRAGRAPRVRRRLRCGKAFRAQAAPGG